MTREPTRLYPKLKPIRHCTFSAAPSNPGLKITTRPCLEWNAPLFATALMKTNDPPQDSTSRWKPTSLSKDKVLMTSRADPLCPVLVAFSTHLVSGLTGNCNKLPSYCPLTSAIALTSGKNWRLWKYPQMQDYSRPMLCPCTQTSQLVLRLP